jgi:AraC-like DNA-binding protein
MPLLVLWDSSAAVLDVRLNARQRWHLRIRANRFDLYAAAHFDVVSTKPTPRDVLILGLPESHTSALLGDAGVDLAFGQCRFQFADRTLARLVRGLVSHARRKEPLGLLYTRSLSTAIVKRLSALAGGSDCSIDAPTLCESSRQVLLDLIDDRLSDPPSMDEMALLSGRSAAEFLKAFKLTFGLTPHQLVLERRIRRAKSLLTEETPLTALALKLGFASHAHFSATFRARTGHTPSEHRRLGATPLQPAS